jgi:hypothetical protein
MRGLKSTLALLVVLVGLGAYIYFVDPQPDSPTPTKEKAFASITAPDIEELRIKSESGDVTSVRKEGDTWQVVSPVAARAAASEVSSVTAALEQLEIDRVIDENASNLAEYGLEPARIEVEFKGAAGKASGTLFVGGKTPTGGHVYARRNDEKKVFLVAAFQEQPLNKSTFDLRDKALVTFERDKIDGLEIAAGSQAMQFKKGTGEWTLSKPVSARADFGTVEAAVGRLETTQMKSVVSETPTPADLKKFGLDPPVATATILLGSARATVAIGGPAGEDAVYARDLSRPAVMTVEKSLADDLKKSVDDYRRKDVFEFRAFNAQRVELTRGGQSLTFERVKGQGENPQDSWKRVSPTAADADKTKVEQLLAGLADMRAVAFTESTGTTGLAQPALTVLAKFEDATAKEETVSFGQRGNDVWVARPGDSGAARIETEKFTEALKQFDELVK